MSLDFKKIFTGVLFSVALSILFVCILAVFVFFLNISDRTISTLIFALSALSVFFGALILGRNISGGGLLHGLFLGVVYFLILSLISLAVSGKISFAPENLFRLTGTLLSGIAGGIFGINSQKNQD